MQIQKRLLLKNYTLQLEKNNLSSTIQILRSLGLQISIVNSFAISLLLWVVLILAISRSHFLTAQRRCPPVALIECVADLTQPHYKVRRLHLVIVDLCFGGLGRFTNRRCDP